MRHFLISVLKPVLRPALISALIPALGAIALAAMIAPPAAAHHVCKDYGQLSDALKSLYGERIVSSRQENDRRLEFWVSDKGTWSLVLVLPNGRSCLKSSGPQPFTEKLRLAEGHAARSAGQTSSG